MYYYIYVFIVSSSDTISIILLNICDISMHFFIISSLSLCAKNNLDQWYQSKLLLIVFFNACPQRGPSIESWISSLSLLRTISLTPKKPSMVEENKNDGVDDPISMIA
jgi:hypothetical protein